MSVAAIHVEKVLQEFHGGFMCIHDWINKTGRIGRQGFYLFFKYVRTQAVFFKSV